MKNLKPKKHDMLDPLSKDENNLISEKENERFKNQARI